MKDIKLIFGIDRQRPDVGHWRRKRLAFSEYHGRSIQADGKANAGRGPITQGRGQAVVAAAAAERVLRPTQAFVLVFEDGPGVVVQATHQLGIQGERNRFRTESLPDRLEGLRARLAEMVDDARRLKLQFLVLRFLRVEQAQWVLLESHAAFRAQLGQIRAIVVAEQLAIRRTADLVPNAVEQEMDASGIERAEPAPAQNDRLDIEEGAGIADRFDTELTEFVEATALRPFRAKIRAQVIETDRLRLQLHARVEVGADDRCSPLRAQGQGSIASVLEREHLLAHDVARLSHGAHKELGGLEGRGFNPQVTEPLGEVFRRTRHPVPVRLLRRQQILRSAGTLRDRRHGLERIAKRKIGWTSLSWRPGSRRCWHRWEPRGCDRSAWPRRAPGPRPGPGPRECRRHAGTWRCPG